MGMYDEIGLDERTRSLPGGCSGDGMFQTKYHAADDGYIMVYNLVRYK